MRAAELGCHRRSPGAALYLEDVLSTVEARGSHWAFYSFREDGYDGYDYEVGDGPLPPGYWAAKERGEPFTLERGPNPLWDPIGRRLESSRPPEAGR